MNEEPTPEGDFSTRLSKLEARFEQLANKPQPEQQAPSEAERNELVKSRYYDSRFLANRYGVTLNTIHYWANTNQIIGRKVGRWRFLGGNILKFEAITGKEPVQ